MVGIENVVCTQTFTRWGMNEWAQPENPVPPKGCPGILYEGQRRGRLLAGAWFFSLCNQQETACWVHRLFFHANKTVSLFLVHVWGRLPTLFRKVGEESILNTIYFSVIQLSLPIVTIIKFCTLLNTYTCNTNLAFSPALLSPFPVVSTWFRMKHWIAKSSLFHLHLLSCLPSYIR